MYKYFLQLTRPFDNLLVHYNFNLILKFMNDTHAKDFINILLHRIIYKLILKEMHELPLICHYHD